MGFWEQFLQGGAGLYGYDQLLGDFKTQQGNISKTIGDLQDYTTENGQFQPYALRGPMGNTSFNPEGLDMTLNQQQKDISQQMFSGGRNLLNQSMQGTGLRENAIYDQIRAAQMPEEQRQLGALRNASHAMGRSGIRSEAYGGTPEQLAFEKARQESMLNARLGSMDQARAETQDQYTRGLGMLGAGYQPFQQQLQQAALGMDYGQLLQRPQENMLQAYTNLGLGGLGTEVNMSNIMGNAFGNMVSAGAGMLGGLGGAVDDAGSWGKWLEGIFNPS